MTLNKHEKLTKIGSHYKYRLKGHIDEWVEFSTVSIDELKKVRKQLWNEVFNSDPN